MGIQIKSLTLFNLDNIIELEVKCFFLFVIQYEIKSRKDMKNLLIYYILKQILQTYRYNSGMIVFYMSQACYNWLDEKDGIINKMDFKKVLNVITKKIPFPIIVSSLPYKKFEELLKSKSPEYDEIVNNYKFISDFLSKVIRVIKNLKFYKLDEKISNNIMEQLKIVTSFNSNES